MQTATVVKGLALVAVAGAAYVVIAGTTGFCSTCEGVMDSVMGRATPVSHSGGSGNIAQLTASDLDGTPVLLEQFVGRPTILELWATWCPPCRAQREVMTELGPELEGKVNIVSLSVDSGSEVVREHLKRHAPLGVELMATPEIIEAMGSPQGIPAIGFVDAEGRLQDVRIGMQSASAIRQALGQL